VRELKSFFLGTSSLLNKEKVPGAITLHQTNKFNIYNIIIF